MLTEASAFDSCSGHFPGGNIGIFYALFRLHSLFDIFDKFYIGQSKDISDRLRRHNSGCENATAPYLPWKMLWHTEKESRAEAMVLEKKLKNLSKDRIKQFIQKYR